MSGHARQYSDFNVMEGAPMTATLYLKRVPSVMGRALAEAFALARPFCGVVWSVVDIKITDVYDTAIPCADYTVVLAGRYTQ